MKNERRTLNQRGSTLPELLIGLSVITLVTTSVFTGLTQFMFTAAKDELYQNLRNDLYLSMAWIRRDCHMATNVVAKAGNRTTDATTLVVRLPALDMNEEVIPDTFEFVSYTISGSPVQGAGLIREVWTDQNAGAPERIQILNDHLVALGFMYGGRMISEVGDLSQIRDIEVVMVAGRETGLRLDKKGANVEMTMEELSVLNDLLDLGMDFSSLRSYIDYMNSQQIDVTIAATLGATTVRNKNTMGLKEVIVPIQP